MTTESDDTASKTCRDCGETKPLSEFHRNSSQRDGRAIYCRPCFLSRHRRYRRASAIRRGQVVRERVAAPAGMKRCPRCATVLPVEGFGRNRASSDGLTSYCRPCHNAVAKANRERRHGSTREYHLRRRYGIGEVDVAAMIEKQGGLCAACGVDTPVHVDHDHKTGFVRGILCFLCNQALGNVRDEVARLQALIRYLSAAPRLVVEEYPPCECHVFEIAGPLHRVA